MTRAPRELEAILEPATDEARIAASWQRIRRGRKDAARTVRPLRFGVGFALAAAAALVAWIAWPTGGGPLASRDPAVAIGAGAAIEAPAASPTPRSVALADDSVILLAPGARLEVLNNEADRFVALLRRGRVHFDVHPGGPRRWQIESSRATVEVVGTAFVVSAEADQLVVEVERGVVMVRGERVPGRVVRLTAGQRIVVRDPVVETTAAPPGVPGPVIAPAHVPLPGPVPGPGPAPAPRASVVARAPVAIVAAAPVVAPEPAPVAPADPIAAALVAADDRRAHGDPAGAAAILEAALVGARPDESAGLAEFALGRLDLDQLAQPARAAAAFERVITIGAPSGLVEDAYARRATALVRAGQRAAAQDALAAYERAYPRGLHRAELHALLAAP